jgi:uncharacterized membrane protein
MADVFRKIGEGVLGFRKIPSKAARRARKLKRKAARKPVEEVPQRLRGFFQNRHAGWPEYVMLKVQIVVVLLFLAAVIFAVLPGAPQEIFIPMVLALSAYALYLAPTQLRRAFKRDYPAYRAFVLMCICIAWALVLAFRYLPTELLPEAPYAAVLPALGVVVFVLAAFMGFRLKYGRDYAYGVVESVKGGRAMVRIRYDLRSNVKHGLYLIESLVKVKKGDQVKVGVERPILGLRGARVKAILEKVK